MIDPDFHLPNTPSPAVPAQPYLDPQNQAFIDAGIKAGGPSLESLSYTAAREVLEGLQAHTPSSDVTREELSILVGATSSLVKTYLYKPASTKEVKVLPTIFYFHGGGWILGSPHTHDSLVRDLVRQTGAAVVFPKYTPAPEGKFPKVFEEVYGVVESIVKRGAKHDLAISKIAFAGDSVGGHMAIAMSILAAQRKLPAKIVYQA
jgi:acetyl esterase